MPESHLTTTARPPAAVTLRGTPPADERGLPPHVRLLLDHRRTDDGMVAPSWDVRVPGFDPGGGARAAALDPAYAPRWEALYVARPDMLFPLGSRAIRRWIRDAFPQGTLPEFEQSGGNGGELVLRTFDGIPAEFPSEADYVSFVRDETRDAEVRRLAAVVALTDEGMAGRRDLLEAEFASERARQECDWEASRRSMPPEHSEPIRLAEADGARFRPDADGWWVVREGFEEGPYDEEREAALAYCEAHGLEAAPPTP